ncbi:MAG TPA: cell division protein ZapA [Vicinamibacterales bacterium]|nr:cell division protein ZapA [Vicinamibacterales bacterium]
MADLKVVTVEIQGQQYPIKTSLDDTYVHRLAAHVEQRLQKAAQSAPSADTVGLAILTALNITDEYFRARAERAAETDTIAERAAALERIVDQALQLAD